MLRNLIVLPDGTEIFSGTGTANAVQSATITECVNSEAELTLGSVCASMLEATLITPGGGLNIAAGAEVTAYKVDDSGVRTKVGLFTLEKPTRPSANMYKITAYDRVSWLDKDLTAWLAALGKWPYKLYDFAQMVCAACGLILHNESLPNGDYEIRKFSADGITGRRMLEWVGQACGRFCRATAEGEIEFAWYTSTDITITPSGERFYYRGGLTREDYVTAPIEKVQLRLTEDDVGAVFPDNEENVNTYIITGNYLLTTDTTEALKPLAQSIYETLRDVSYVPCKVTIPSCLDIHAGDIITVTDSADPEKPFTVYVMTKTQSGQRDTLECTGSSRRDSPSAVNNESVKALSGKVMEVKKTVQELAIRASDLQTQITGKTEVTTQLTTDIKIMADSLSVEMSKQTSDIDRVKTDLSAIRQSTEQFSIDIQNITNNGVSQITTGKGYVFNDEGLIISSDGDEMENKLNHEGMLVSRDEEPIFQATADGCNAVNLTARKYLIAGSYARFENYSDGSDQERTGCFFLG